MYSSKGERKALVVVYFPQVCSRGRVNAAGANDDDESYEAELAMTKTLALSLISPFRWKAARHKMK